MAFFLPQRPPHPLGLALVALLAGLASATAFPTSARAEDSEYQPMLLAGAGLGLTEALGPVLETHLGVGAHLRKLRLVGVLDYARSTARPIFGSWSIVRHHVAFSALAIYSPIAESGFHLHGSVGGGLAWDGLDDGVATRTERRLAYVGSAGVGWKVLTVMVRAVLPPPHVEQPLQDAGPGAVFGDDGVLQFLVTGSYVLDFGS